MTSDRASVDVDDVTLLASLVAPAPGTLFTGVETPPPVVTMAPTVVIKDDGKEHPHSRGWDGIKEQAVPSKTEVEPGERPVFESLRARYGDDTGGPGMGAGILVGFLGSLALVLPVWWALQ